MLPRISRSSYQERSLDAYGEALAARGWSDVAARSVDWDEGLVARDDYYARSYDDSELYARTSYDAYVDSRMQRRENARVLARELVNLLYARNSECRASFAHDYRLMGRHRRHAPGVGHSTGAW